MEIQPPQKVKVAPIEGKGRGVVATEEIAQGEVIEVCPLLVLPEEDAAYVTERSGFLRFYALELVRTGQQVIALGYGSLYNHSRSPNADVEYEAGEDCIRVFALRDIQPSEEIVYDYHFEGEEEFLPLDLNLHLGAGAGRGSWLFSCSEADPSWRLLV